MELSIILPVYNVEKYIYACIESIFQQGLDDNCFEVIIVNDGTQDNSIEVITDIVRQHNNITIINQENQGLSVARNNGIAVSKGEYILMPDSDDLLFENSLPLLLKKALDTKADIVMADYLIIKDEGTTCCSKDNYPPQKDFWIQESRGEDIFLENLNPKECFVWRTLYRRVFLHDNNIKFIPGLVYEDIPFTHECYLKAGKCLKASWLLYIHREARTGSITSDFTFEKAKSFCKAIASTWQLTETKGLSQNVRNRLKDNTFCSFSIMVHKSLHSLKTPSERKQIIIFLKEIAPSLNFTHGVKQKLTNFMIRKKPGLFMELYYIYAQIVYKKKKRLL